MIPREEMFQESRKSFQHMWYHWRSPKPFYWLQAFAKKGSERWNQALLRVFGPHVRGPKHVWKRWNRPLGTQGVNAGAAWCDGERVAFLCLICVLLCNGKYCVFFGFIWYFVLISPTQYSSPAILTKSPNVHGSALVGSRRSIMRIMMSASTEPLLISNMSISIFKIFQKLSVTWSWHVTSWLHIL